MLLHTRSVISKTLPSAHTLRHSGRTSKIMSREDGASSGACAVESSVDTKSVTRDKNKVTCPLFGECNELPRFQLPTCSDVVKACLKEKHLATKRTGNHRPPWKDIRESLMISIKDIWISSSIPFLTDQRIRQKLDKLHNDYEYFIKQRKNSSKFLSTKKQKFITECQTNLFDIAKCKCEKKCRCFPDDKIPKQELPFICDQRGSRKMYIGGLDPKTNRKLKLKEARSMRSNPNALNSPVPTTSTAVDSTAGTPSPENSMEIVVPSNDNQDYEIPHARIRDKSPLEKLPKLINTAIICDRFSIDDRDAGAVCSAFAQDLGLVTEENRSLVVDKSKIRRDKAHTQEVVRGKRRLNKSPIALSFDGRKDRTATMVSQVVIRN